MDGTRKRLAAAAVLAAALLLAACKGTAPPVRFYTLLERPAASPAAVTAAADDALAVGVGPLRLPRLLDRPQIVTREGGNRLRLAEFQRWGGPLEEEMLAAITDRLSQLLASPRVMAHPFADHFEPEFRVQLVVHRFEGRLGDSVALDVTWTVTGPRGRRVLAVRRSLIHEPLAAGDYDSLVTASRRALHALAGEIAGQILALKGRSPVERSTP